MAFDLETRTKVLLWCDRHCCLCKKDCGINIEVHHVEPEVAGGSDDIDNAIPLCFDCHGAVQHYNNEHPREQNTKLMEKFRLTYKFQSSRNPEGVNVSIKLEYSIR